MGNIDGETEVLVWRQEQGFFSIGAALKVLLLVIFGPKLVAHCGYGLASLGVGQLDVKDGGFVRDVHVDVNRRTVRGNGCDGRGWDRREQAKGQRRIPSDGIVGGDEIRTGGDV